jgi:type III secretory pathway component EscU
VANVPVPVPSRLAHNIPVIERKPLAQALYHHVDLNKRTPVQQVVFRQDVQDGQDE